MTAIRNTLAAAVLTTLSATTALVPAASAHAATSQFPPAFTPFTIQLNGLCAQRVPAGRGGGLGTGYSIGFIACDPTKTTQQWVRAEFDPEAAGIVYGVDGTCISQTGVAAFPAYCQLAIERGKGATISWRQEADGEVDNDASTPAFWATSITPPRLTTKPNGGAAFDLVPVS